MSDPIVSPLQAGEIIPQCGTTLDVGVDALHEVWVGGQRLTGLEPFVVCVSTERPGLMRLTLSLPAGHRLMVRQPQPPSTATKLTTTMVESEWQQALKWRERFLDDERDDAPMPLLDPQIICYLIADCMTMRQVHDEQEAAESKVGDQ